MNSLIGIVNYEIGSSINISTIDHSKLQNLLFLQSGHIGFQPSSDQTLLTNSKETTGAINELYNKFNQSISNHINGGNPYTKGSLIIDGGLPDSIHIKTINGGTP